MSKKDDRRKEILAFLRAREGYVTRSELCTHFRVSMPSLTADLKYLLESGIPLDMPARSGNVRLVRQGSAPGIFEPIRAKDIRKWAIIRVLCEYPSGLSLKDLARELYYLASDTYETAPPSFYREVQETASPAELVSESTLYKDLNDMKAEGLVTARSAVRFFNGDYHEVDIYLRSADMPQILRKTEDELLEFCGRYTGEIVSGNWRSALLDLYEKCCLLTDAVEEDMDLLPYQSKGTQGMYAPDLTEKLSRLTEAGYQTHMIEFPYKGKKKQVTKRFRVGLLVYSRERNRLYILGEEKNGIPQCLPLDSIDTGRITRTQLRNNVYEAEKYLDIFDEMFYVSAEKPVYVKVLFKNFGTVPEKVYALKATRHTKEAKITLVPGEHPDKPDLLYEDKIRGMEDFSHYLRSFGRSAIVLEPKELVRRMTRSCENVIQAYMEILEPEGKMEALKE